MTTPSCYCVGCGRRFVPAEDGVVVCAACGGPAEGAATRAEAVTLVDPEGAATLVDPEGAATKVEGVATLVEPGAPAEEAPDRVPLEWPEGTVVLGTYRAGRVFEGGMGRVQQVHHLGWDLDLAVKTPKAELLARDGGAEAFVAEAQAWVELGLHPHIVSCFYVRTLGGVPRVFAEWVEGGSLADAIDAGHLYTTDDPLAAVLDVAIQIAWGLGHAHGQGLVHQDVKPANVMLTTDGQAKVTDFGLTRAAITPTDQPAAGTTVLAPSGGYTPAYAAPEQLEAATTLTRRADVYSLAMTVLTMLTGGCDWELSLVGATRLDELATGARSGPTGTLPPALTTLLAACLARDPDQRPHTILAVADQLTDLHTQHTGVPYPRTRPDPAQMLAASLNNKALSLLDLGQTQPAEQTWQHALEIEPFHPASVYNLALARWRTAQTDDLAAMAAVAEMCRARPGQSRARYLLACVQLERDDCEAAVAALDAIPVSDRDRLEITELRDQAARRRPGSTRLLRTFDGHTKPVTSVRLSADGRHALSGSADQTLKLWDVATGTCLRTFDGHTDTVRSVSLSTDGRHALSGGEDRRLRLWDVASGRCLRTLDGHTEPVYSVLLSADGRHALSGSGDTTVKLWDVVTGTCLRTWRDHTSFVYSVWLSADGRQALTGSNDRTLKLWDVATGTCLRTFVGHRDAVASACLSADGRHALTGSNDTTLKLWDVPTGTCLRTFDGHTGFVHSVRLSGDGDHALSGSMDQTLKLWDLSTGRCLRTLTGHEGWVRSVSLSTDGHHVLSGSTDTTVKLWTVAPTRFTAPVEVSAIVTAGAALERAQRARTLLAQAAESRDRGTHCQALRQLRQVRALPDHDRHPEALAAWADLYTALPRGALRAGFHVRSFDGHTGTVTSVCLTDDGRHALSSGRDRTVKLWEVTTGACLRTLVDHTESVRSVCLSADGRLALSSGWTGTLALWDVTSGDRLRIFERKGPIAPCLSDDGHRVLASDHSGTMELWEVATERRLRTFKGHRGVATTIRLSADGRHVLSGSADRTLKLWDVASGRCVHTFEGHTAWVNAACLSGDGRHALSGGDETMRLWDLATGSCLRTFEGHTNLVSAVCLSEDGRHALSGSWDRTLKLWDVTTGRCLRTFRGHTRHVTSLASSRDGRHALSGSDDGALMLWDCPSFG
jgi:WD40 repeat protein/serine/threonine protein kinase